MSFVENLLIPVITLTFTIFLVGWFFYLVYWIIKAFAPNTLWIIKYKVFRRPYSVKDIELGMDALAVGKDDVVFKKDMLLKGKGRLKVHEMLYIYNQMKLKAKGGDEHGQFGESNGEIEQVKETG